MKTTWWYTPIILLNNKFDRGKVETINIKTILKENYSKKYGNNSY